MEIKQVEILSGLVLIILCFSLYILVRIYDRKQQLEESQLAQRVLYVNIMEQRADHSIKGGKLFKRNCTQCHQEPNQKHFDLDRIFERRNTEYFSKIVTNEDSLLEVEDPQTVWINDVYGGGDYMHTFSLDKKEIDQLIEYLREAKLISTQTIRNHFLT